jgi:hypothetical protein
MTILISAGDCFKFDLIISTTSTSSSSTSSSWAFSSFIKVFASSISILFSIFSSTCCSLFKSSIGTNDLTNSFSLVGVSYSLTFNSLACFSTSFSIINILGTKVSLNFCARRDASNTHVINIFCRR